MTILLIVPSHPSRAGRSVLGRRGAGDEFVHQPQPARHRRVGAEGDGAPDHADEIRACFDRVQRRHCHRGDVAVLDRLERILLRLDEHRDGHHLRRGRTLRLRRLGDGIRSLEHGQGDGTTGGSDSRRADSRSTGATGGFEQAAG